MCWTSVKIPKLKVAKYNIPVFKVMSLTSKADTLSSIYMGFNYEIGKEYTSTIGEVFGSPVYCIDEGFHSYSLGCTVSAIGKLTMVFASKTVHQLDVYGSETILVKCIIPKGSSYYLNENGEYVSNKIKLLKKYTYEENI